MGSRSPTRGRGPRVSAVREEGDEDADADAFDGAEGEDGTPSHRRRTMSVPMSMPVASSPFTARWEHTNANEYKYDKAPSPSPSPTGRFRNGRVRGMVRSFESSGSESGSPERERDSREGSGFRKGSGFRVNGGGSGFRNGKTEQGEGAEEDDAVHGTVKPGRALPARPDGMSMGMGMGMRIRSGSGGGGEVDLGATVREYDHPHAYANGYPANGTITAAAANGTLTANANYTGIGGYPDANAGPSPSDDELTVEELLAREDAGLGLGFGPPPLHAQAQAQAGVLSPNHTGRMGRRLGQQLTGGSDGLAQQFTGGSLTQQRTGGGGRPLPAHPPPHSNRSGSGGVHAWEAEEGAVGATVKRMPMPTTPQSSSSTGVSLRTRVSQSALLVEQPEARADAEAESRQAHARREQEIKEEREQAQVEAQERGRARGAAVRARLTETADLRALVDAFRVRLEEVERKVGEMEAADAEGAQVQRQKQIQKEAVPAPTAGTSLTMTQRLDPRRLLALLAPTSASAAAQRANEGTKEEWVGPTTLGALPSYVLLVGLGVCAVVLRVLVRRGLGAVRGRGVA
ncbi:hypothetical protein B0H19DRAFT_646365 [Mycena capillaripes]|nr:hypothetical protein B0H19DRAFT_646365 [Mycena capillaripes]